MKKWVISLSQLPTLSGLVNVKKLTCNGKHAYTCTAYTFLTQIVNTRKCKGSNVLLTAVYL